MLLYRATEINGSLNAEGYGNDGDNYNHQSITMCINAPSACNEGVVNGVLANAQTSDT